jgi:ribonucleoside-diphosphate reductase beta chain
MHTEFACLLYSDISEKLDQDIVHDMFIEAYQIEKEFICDSLSCALIGMNSDLMAQYIRFVGDRLLVKLGYQKVWNESNPFEWMESISLENKGNFFETRVNDYQKAGVLDNTDKDKKYEVSEDF